MNRRSFLLLGLLPIAGCTASGPRRPASPVVTGALTEPYRLDSGDKLRITVFEQSSLTNSYTVDQAGYVTLPLVGSIAARGSTTQELAGRVAAALRNGFLRNPDVSVEIDTYRPFFIMGEVRNPGQYPFTSGLTVLTAVAVAGGFTARAAEAEVEVTRQLNDKVYTGLVPATDVIRPGDVIRVRQRLI